MIEQEKGLQTCGTCGLSSFSPELHGYANGPDRMVLIGPPGTGKTRTAIDRFIIPALESGGNILCCSFSRAAAGEMRTRVAKILNVGEHSLREQFTTIHSEALRRISKAGTWQLYDGHTRTAKPLGKVKAPPEPDFPTAKSEQRGAIIACWDYARATMINDDEDAMELCASQFASRNPQLQMEYRDILYGISVYEAEKQRGGNYIDFTDMLTMAAKLDSETPIDLLLLDEMQDSSVLQWHTFGRWSEMARKVVIIGDPDQMIFEYAGASAETLKTYFESWDTVQLTKSWRVPAASHAIARSLILRNQDRIDAPYEHNGNQGAFIKSSSLEQVVALADKCAKTGMTMMILARWGVGLEEYRKEFKRRGVPFKNEKGGSPWGKRQQCHVLAAHKRLMDGSDVSNYSLRILCNSLKAKSGVFKGTKVSVMDALSSDAVDINPWDFIHRDKLDAAVAELGLDTSIALIAQTYGVEAIENDSTPVVLTTFHSSKGREADIVVVCMDAPWPVTLAMDKWFNEGRGWEAVESERRCLYVALTRGREATALHWNFNGELRRL